MSKEAQPKRKINFRLPAETYRNAEIVAGQLGISLNDLFSLAVAQYIKSGGSK